MKKIFFLIVIGSLLAACNSEKQKSLRKVKYLSSKIDSITDIYNSIAFNEFKDIKDEIEANGNFLKENAKLIENIDSNYISSFGTYLAAGKGIGRVFKKMNKTIGKELELSKSQLSNLKYDIKNQLISNTDSVAYYITAEQKAVDGLLRNIDIIKSSMNMQQEAYELTREKVDSIIDIAKKNLK